MSDTTFTVKWDSGEYGGSGSRSETYSTIAEANNRALNIALGGRTVTVDQCVAEVTRLRTWDKATAEAFLNPPTEDPA